MCIQNATANAAWRSRRNGINKTN